MRPLSSLEEKSAASILRVVQSLALKQKKELFVVGGALRDALAGRHKRDPDIDLALASGAIAFARLCARSLKAGFVILDEERGIGRVVAKMGAGRTCTLDLSDFRGEGILGDLALRDFTVNALAVPLAAVLESGRFREALIDPLGGMKDLKARRVRAAGPSAFDDDPLRIMRAFSTAALLGGEIEPRTLRDAKKRIRLLSGVSGERIRDELFKVLASPQSHRFISLMDSAGVLEAVIPEIGPMRHVGQGPYHHLDVWGHTLETLRKLEHAMSRLSGLEQVGAYLGTELSCGRTRGQLLRLGAILHDIGKPSTYRKVKGKVTFYGHDHKGAFIAVGICRRLRLSNGEERAMRKTVAMHLRPGFLATVPKVTAKALFRFFRDAGEEAGSILILSLADLRSTRGYKLVEESRGRHERLIKRLLREYFQRQECPPPPRLVDGNDLIRLGLEPSPLFGRILRELEELQAEGKIRSKEEGLKLARAIIKA